MPFSVTLHVYPSTPDNSTPLPLASGIDLKSVLNGTVTGIDPSDVTATIT